jgi:hypothetical protein
VLFNLSLVYAIRNILVSEERGKTGTEWGVGYQLLVCEEEVCVLWRFKTNQLLANL